MSAFGGKADTPQYPLYPARQTSGGAPGIAALCQKATSGGRSRSWVISGDSRGPISRAMLGDDHHRATSVGDNIVDRSQAAEQSDEHGRAPLIIPVITAVD